MKKYSFLLVASIFMFGLAGFANANLITNGDFEDSDSSIVGWNVNVPSNVYLIDNPSNNVVHFSVDGGNGWAVLTQEFYVDPTWDGLSIEFDIHFATGEDASLDWFKQTVGFDVAGQDTWQWAWQYRILTDQDLPDTGWWYHAEAIIPFAQFNIEDTNPNAKLYFGLKENPGDWSWARLDNVEVTKIPEPATILLFGTGMLGIGALGRKKIFRT